MAEPAIVVVGAGPAGIRATVALARAGVRVTLIDEGDRPGGQIYRQPLPGAERPKKDLYGFEWRKADAIHKGARAGARARRLPAAHAGLELLSDHARPAWVRTARRSLTFDRMIIATGAVERMIPVPGWTLPGVYGMGAAQIALKSQGCRHRSARRLRRHRTAAAARRLSIRQGRRDGCRRAGHIAALGQAVGAAENAAEREDLRQGRLLPRRAARAAHSDGQRRRRFPHRRAGAGRARSSTPRTARAARRLRCRRHGFGLRSETQLAELAGCRFEYDTLNRQHLPVRDRAGRSSADRCFSRAMAPGLPAPTRRRCGRARGAGRSRRSGTARRVRARR